MRKVLDVIWGVWERKYFCKEDWTAQITLRSHNKSPGMRDGSGLLMSPADAPGVCISASFGRIVAPFMEAQKTSPRGDPREMDMTVSTERAVLGTGGAPAA